MKLEWNFANQLANIVLTDFCQRIAFIDLSRNNLCDRGSRIVVGAVKQTQCVVSLNLMQNDISPAGMAHIFTELADA